MLGFYDSGIGGFTILREVLRTNKNQNFYYFQDHKILPMGNKSIEQIQDAVKKGVNFLFNQGCVIVVLACNTACVTSIRQLQHVWLVEKKIKDKQVLSITRPFTELLTEKYSHLSKKRGLILSTKATYESGFYQSELKRAGFSIFDFIYFKQLAQAIEDDNTTLIKQELTQKFSNFDLSKIDYVLLACTHYPLIKENIRKFFPLKTTIIDPSPYIAQKLSEYISNHPNFKMKQKKSCLFLNSKTKINLDKKIYKQTRTLHDYSISLIDI